MTDREKELLVKLKCYFTADFMGIADEHSGGCKTCGYGGTSTASLEAIHEAIDDFIKAEERTKP